MKFVSWNVNGLRACIQKDFLAQFQKMDADFFCLQETKLSAGQLQLDLPGYEQYWCYAEKKGYSGTAIFTKHHPLSVCYGIGVPELDNEGRVITLEYKEFYLVTCYTPNAQRGLARIDHRMAWDEAFRSYIRHLDQEKPVVICGDLNVAHKEIDLKNPASNRGNAGFSDEERESFQKTLDLGFTDTVRHLYPDVTGRYSWWSYMFHARENNAGWRIDYFLVSDRIRNQIQQADIYSDILGSDHCPVMLELDTLVNGAIWSPNAGTPSVVETETSKKKAKSASPVNGKAAALLCVVLALMLCIGFLPWGIGQTSQTPTTPTIPETTDNVLFNVQVAKNFSLVKNNSNSELVYSTKRLMFDGQMYYVDTYNTGKLSPSNIYLIITLTDLGKYYQSLGMKPSIKEVDFSNSIVQSAPSLGNVNMTAYYSDEAHTEMLGWLVWANLSSNSTVVVSAEDYNYRVYLDLFTNQYVEPDVTPDYAGIMQIIPFSEPPRIVESQGSYVFYSDSYMLYGPEDLKRLEYNIVNANFWFIVTLTLDGIELLGDEKISLSYGYTRQSGDDYLIDAIPYYSVSDPNKTAGWIFYGRNISSVFSITARTSTANLVYNESYEITPFIQKDQAYKMTTKELVEHILDNEIITSLYWTSDLESDYLYAKLLKKYPAVAILNSRADAGEILDLYEDPFAKFLLDCWIVYYEPLSDDEIAEINGFLADVIVYDRSLRVETNHVGDLWITTIIASDGTYYTTPTGFLPDNMFFLIRVQLKEEYIGIFLADSDISYTIGGTAGSTQIVEIPYYTDETLQEVAGWFIYGPSSITSINNIIVDQITIYGDTVNVTVVTNPQIYVSMSTQTLIDYIINDEQLNRLYKTDQENLYEYMLEKYPIVAELNTREDAVVYLAIYEHSFARFLLKNWLLYNEVPDTDEVEGPMANIIVYDAPLKFTQFTVDSQTMTRISATDGIYYAGNVNVPYKTVAVRVELTEEYVGLFDDHYTLSYTTDNILYSYVPYYIDENKTHIGGWIIFGSENLTSITNIHVDQFTIYSDEIVPIMIVNETGAANMQTIKLIQYIMETPSIVDKINNPDPSISSDWIGYLCRIYPAINELLVRKDVETYFEQWTASDSEGIRLAATTLLEYWYQNRIIDENIPM